MRIFSFAILALALALACLGSGRNAATQRDYMGNWTANPFAGPPAYQPPGTFTNPQWIDATSPQIYERNGGFRNHPSAHPAGAPSLNLQY